MKTEIARFLQGLLLGLAAASMVAALFIGPVALKQNLGYSVLPFTAVALLYAWQLLQLHEALQQNAALTELDHLAHYLDTWATVFFAVGVIWTAIGMRAALMGALGDGSGFGQMPPAALLAKLVDGGILLALSTTIIGGLGGYLMRLGKTLVVGRRMLERQYQEDDDALAHLIGGLNKIEAKLDSG